MIKVKPDPKLVDSETVNSMEIVSTSNPPKKTSFLSKYLIPLLHYGGVPMDYFMDLLISALEDSQKAQYHKLAALRVAVQYGKMDDYLVPRMILCGMPLDEPYLQYRLSKIMAAERKGLKGGKIPVSESYYLMGTADPTGLLNSDEVCIIMDKGQIVGEVLVYTNPGMHFGDIHVLKATYVKELENIVGNAKFAIFFPTKGPRSLADEMANSDFDGDMYWVSRNPELLKYYKPSKPWEKIYPTSSASLPTPAHFSSDKLEHELFQQFITARFHRSNIIGTASDSWLAFMDRLLTLGDDCAEEKNCLKEKMLQLTDIYYDALDAPKSGKKIIIPKYLRAEKFPHFMERRNSFNSKSVLGQIHDKVESFQSLELQSKEVWKLPCFSGEVEKSCLLLWTDHYDQYRTDMKHALELDQELKNEAANRVLQKYKQILYGAAEFEESPRSREEIFNEALSIYQVNYDYANKVDDVGKCGFAWKIAGRALYALYAKMQDEDVIICSKSILHEILN